MARLGLWWQVLSTAMRSRSNQQFYDRISPIYDQVFVGHKIHAENIADMLFKSYTGCESTTRVLDLGCGTGMLCHKLFDKGFDVIGLDISFESLRLLRQHKPQISTINANATLLPLVNGCCQAVVSLGVWRHFSDLQSVIEELIRILTRDGFLIIGYFPPAVGGALYQGSGIWSRFLVRLYHLLTKKLGYVDRVDLLLESQTVSLAKNYFEQVYTVDSGEYWHLIIAQRPIARMIR